MSSPCGHGPDDLRVRPNGVRECAACRRARVRRRHHRRLPLVYATGRAITDSHALMPGRVIENIVADALKAGRLRRAPGDGGTAILDLDDALVAVVGRARSPLTGRKAWRVVAVRHAHQQPNSNELRS